MWLFGVMWFRQLCLKKKPKIPKLSKAHKAEVTVTFLKEQNIRVLAPQPPSPNLPYSPSLALCDFCLFSFFKEKLADFPTFRNQVLARAAYIVCIRQLKCLGILAQTTGTVCVCEAEESTLKECDCCR